MDNIYLNNLKDRVFVIAEIGNNHEGCFERCLGLIDEAKNCGVDAIKLQTYDPDLFYDRDQKQRILQLKNFSLKKDELIEIKKHCDKKRIHFFSTPFDIESAKFLNSIQSFFKIASGDNNYLDLIDTVLLFNKPVLISTGLADHKQIEKIYNHVCQRWKKMSKKKFLVLLHCVSSYPVVPNEANLLAIKTLKKKFPGIEIGYSDHCEGIQSAILAVALGARVIEKHFTDDKNYSDYRDHKLSADPSEMKKLVGFIRESEKMMGDGKLKISDSEIINLLPTRRSMAAKRFIPKETIISYDDIMWVRPGDGITEKNKVVGKKSLKDIEKGHKFSLKDFFS